MIRYPLARYHQMTGALRLVLSQEEEALLGPEWSACQTDVRYPANPKPIIDKPVSPPIFSIEIPEAK